MKTKPINQQTQGPVTFDAVSMDGYPVQVLGGKQGRYIGEVCTRHLTTDPTQDEANARLLASSYSSFDRAARALNVDAAELAEGIDLAGLIRSLQDMVDAGGYVIDMIHETADPKSNAPVDWKGIAMHAYASLNGIQQARAQLSKLPKPATP